MFLQNWVPRPVTAQQASHGPTLGRFVYELPEPSHGDLNRQVILVSCRQKAAFLSRLKGLRLRRWAWPGASILGACRRAWLQRVDPLRAADPALPGKKLRSGPPIQRVNLECGGITTQGPSGYLDTNKVFCANACTRRRGKCSGSDICLPRGRHPLKRVGHQSGWSLDSRMQQPYRAVGCGIQPRRHALFATWPCPETAGGNTAAVACTTGGNVWHECSASDV